jgi:hypothetical protein
MVPGVSATGGQISTQFAKSYLYITTICFTFGTPEYNGSNEMERQINETNGFYWPARKDAKGTVAHAGRPYDPDEDVVEMQVHIGSQVFPQYPIRPLAEFSFRLMQGLDLTASAEGIAIRLARYRVDCFIFALDLEKAGSGPGGGVSYTGVNTSTGGGATIRLEAKNINAYPGNPISTPPQSSQIVDRVYMTLVYSVKINLQANGVTVSE